MSVKLYVGNLSYDTTSEDLKDLFSAIGSVASCTVIEDRFTRSSRGFAFVEMSSDAEGENAVAQLDGLEVAGRRLKVSRSTPTGERDIALPGERSSDNPVFGTHQPLRAYYKQPVDIFG